MKLYLHNGDQIRIINASPNKATITIGAAVVTLNSGEEKLYNYAQWNTGVTSLPMIATSGGNIVANAGNVQVDVAVPIWNKRNLPGSSN